MAFKPIDPKRDEFRRYLERAGVIESLTKVFVRILRERPENPLEFLRQNLGDTVQQADNVTYLQNEIEEARFEIQRLREIIRNINPDALDEQSGGSEILQDQLHNHQLSNNATVENVVEGAEENKKDDVLSIVTTLENAKIIEKQESSDFRNEELPEDDTNNDHISTPTPSEQTQKTDDKV